jgi:uncharacterized iron-regulated protein
MKIVLLHALLLMTAISFGQDKPAYKIYDANGREVSYKKMLKTVSTSDITLFGELHNNAIAHWLELEVTKDLHTKRKLTLGAEMIEADNQNELNAYLAGSIDSKTFDSVARLWINHETDYAPLVNFARDNALNFIASNIPRRYANLVYKEGFGALDSLSEDEKAWIAPLPVEFDSELPTYKNILEMMGEHGTPELVMAQAMKDATMAYFILKNFVEGNLFIHYNGSYHSNHYEGIGWYLKKNSPEKHIVTIGTVEQENVNKLEKEYKGIADFIICVDIDMTTTY